MRALPRQRKRTSGCARQSYDDLPQDSRKICAGRRLCLGTPTVPARALAAADASARRPGGAHPESAGRGPRDNPGIEALGRRAVQVGRACSRTIELPVNPLQADPSSTRSPISQSAGRGSAARA